MIGLVWFCFVLFLQLVRFSYEDMKHAMNLKYVGVNSVHFSCCPVFIGWVYTMKLVLRWQIYNESVTKF